MTVEDVMKEKIGKEPVWDFQVFGPCGMQDPLEIHVQVSYGKTRKLKTENYIIKITDFELIDNEAECGPKEG